MAFIQRSTVVDTVTLDRYGRPVGDYLAEGIGQLDLEEHVEQDFLYLACEPSRGQDCASDRSRTKGRHLVTTVMLQISRMRCGRRLL